MELNPKCVRDVMLAIEELTGLTDSLTAKPVSLNDLCTYEFLQKYSDKEIFYTLLKLNEGDYIHLDYSYASSALYKCDIKDLTMQGHEYLETIRSNKAFDYVLDKINEIGGGATIEIIKALALKFLKDRFGV